MLIILETSPKAHLLQQCYTMLSAVLTTAHLLDWGLQEDRPAVVAREMIDWAMAGDVAVQTVWRLHADNSGDESGGGEASCGNANPAAG